MYALGRNRPELDAEQVEHGAYLLSLFSDTRAIIRGMKWPSIIGQEVEGAGQRAGEGGVREPFLKRAMCAWRVTPRR